jgi:hypothetical protein
MLQPLGGKALTLILDAPGKGGAPSYLYLLPPTKTNENPTKILEVIMEVTKAPTPQIGN